MRNLIAICIILFAVNASAQDGNYKGKYSWGEGVDTFQPCGSQKIYWVSHGWGSINSDLNGFYRKHTTKPYQAIYIEFRGHFHYEESDGFAADYDGIIHISEIKKLSGTIPDSCKGGS
jgi:hypothetical protein